MAEEQWVLNTPDGKKIYGLINSTATKKNNKVIIHIHGLGGKENGYAQTRMAMTFPKHGYDIVRVNLYSSKPDARSLLDCTIKKHAQDIDFIVQHFKTKYKKVFATGHSYGGPSLMTSNVNQLDAVSLWDPTYIPSILFSEKYFVKSGDYFISPEGNPMVLTKAFIDEAKLYTRDNSVALAQKCTIPLQVIYAKFWLETGESFHTHSKGLTDERIIKKSVHAFYEEGSTAPLLRYTKNWFDQF